MTTLLVKNPRKQRIVIGAYVDIDSVTDKPGNDYCEWIRIAKGHLKEREWKILEIITTEIELIVNMNKYCCSSNNNNNDNDNDSNFIITEDIINNTIKQLYERIDEWNGLNLIKTKTSLTRYRDYYNKAKNWWDQTKRKLIGTIFWIIIFKQIEQFVDNAKERILNLIRLLLTGKIAYNNTRPVPLINAASIVYSEEISRFLLYLDDRLTINAWIVTQKIHGNGKTKPSKIIIQLQSELNQITSTNTDNSSSSNIPNVADVGMDRNAAISVNKMENNGNDVISISNIINHRLSIPSVTSLPQNENNTEITSIAYGVHHKASHSVSDLRYNPTHNKKIAEK